MPNSEQILAANEKLRGEIKSFQESLNTLKQKERHTRWIAYALAAVLTLAGFIFLYDRSRENRDLIDLQRQYDAASCERGNAGRSAQREQWQDVRALLYGLGADRETRRLADDLVKGANENFPVVDCRAILAGQPAPTPTGGPK